tara:strand:+ start:5180 stop:7423 length:2244 start_codon:yes stop_codon:yes gene_type:complete
MEFIVLSSVIGLGFMLNKDGVDRENIIKQTSNEIDSNGTNIYNSKDTVKYRKKEQSMANKLYNKATNSIESNVMIPGPPSAIISNNKKFDDSILPLEFDNDATLINTESLPKETVFNNINISDSSNKESSGWNKMVHGHKYNKEILHKHKKKISQLTGEEFENHHNNCVPYFGSSVTQNVNENATGTIVDMMTGADKVYREKCEIPVMFKPTTNITNPYGSQSLDSNEYERYIVGNIRNNESPMEKTYVGPGLNKGYTSEPDGGYQQIDTRDYVLPKETNQLRVKTNPKLSFNGRIVSGKKISRPGKVGVVEKNRPDSFSVWSPDRLFTTVGECSGATQRSKIPLKYTNRKTTVTKNRIGPAGPATFRQRKSALGKTAPSLKNLFESFGFRNVFAEMEDPLNNDHGKKNTNLRKVNKKIVDLKKPVRGNIRSKNGNYFQNRQRPRFTKKTNVVGNSRWASNIQRPHNRHKIYDPNDVARTTIKETNIHDSSKLNLKPDQASNVQIKDPNDVAKVTIKETNIHDSEKLNMKPERPSKNLVKDPDDLAKTTVKETTQLENYINNPKESHETGYINKSKNIEAVTTNRQTTTTEYTGDAKGEDVGGYNVANPNPKNTVRQFTSDYEYEGIAGPSTENKPISYEDIYNSTIRSIRQDISEGRTPSTQGPKNSLGGTDMNVTTNKVANENNIKVNKRGVSSTKVYNSLPQPEKCYQTTNKSTLPNQDRLDPDMLTAFKENPYTQSLHSHVFS